MEDSTQMKSISCKYPEYNIPVRRSYEKYRDKLLNNLWNNESSNGVAENQLSEDSFIEDIIFYPNPAKNKFIVKFVSKEDIILNVNIYDYTGKLVNITNPKMYMKGNNNLQIDISSLPKGIYNCMLKTANGMSFSKKIIKL